MAASWESGKNSTRATGNIFFVRSAGQTPPVGLAPVIENRGIGQRVGIAIVDAALRFFDVVSRRIERPPATVTSLDVERLAPFAAVASLGGAEFGEVVLSVFERNMVGTARQAREAELRQIVLPQADRATFAAARLAGEHPVATARTGEQVLVPEHSSNIAVIDMIATARKKRGGCPPLCCWIAQPPVSRSSGGHSTP